jgi:hypothetical protein
MTEPAAAPKRRYTCCQVHQRAHVFIKALTSSSPELQMSI